jgi:hypothetical protein
MTVGMQRIVGRASAHKGRLLTGSLLQKWLFMKMFNISDNAELFFILSISP